MKASNQLTHKKRTHKVVVLAGCFAVLFSLLFPFQYAFAKDFEKGNAASHSAIKSHHNPDQLPFTPGPIIEPSSTGEGETADDSDDDLHKLTTPLFTQGAEELHSQKNTFVQLKTSIENRTTVSYVILYHSWKSFLITLA